MKTFHCLAQAINKTSSSVICGRDPSKEDIHKAVYYGLCRPQDVSNIKINCYFNQYVESITKSSLPFYDRQFHPRCWCGFVSYDLNDISNQKYNFMYIINGTCKTKLTWKNLRWMVNLFSLHLYGLELNHIDYGMVKALSVLVLSKTEIEEISLHDINKMDSIHILSLRSHRYSNILQNWWYQLRLMKWSVLYLNELEITDCDILYIPDQLFTYIQVRRALSLAFN